MTLGFKEVSSKPYGFDLDFTGNEMIIDDELTAAFNAKPKIDINKIKTMSPGQLDAVKTYGSGAENLLSNRDFALFVHHFKFDIAE